MSPQRFLDRFRAFKGQEQQGRGVLLLHQAISQLPGSEAVLSEEAPWALEFSTKPSTPAAKPTSSRGTAIAPLDPRGSEEAGMAGPMKKAPVKAGDSYLLVNDRDQDMEAYDHTGQLLWKVPALARGQGADTEWRHTGTDTPPGLYKLGRVYLDYEADHSPPRDATLQAYGWYSFDMVELEGQEKTVGRAGIMLHGGGTGCGWPGAWAPQQKLLPTLGCIRVHNIVLRDKVLPLYEQGTVYVGVFQEI
ncbi:MAG: L,D-transpeptidase [Prochlorococcaceae cyanobacterium]